MEFSTVVVTYGDEQRFKGLASTIKSALDAGSKKIILVDNGTQYELVDKVKEELKSNKVKIKSLPSNEGSAKGFIYGIEEVLKDQNILQNEYILILDDDVTLDKDFLHNFSIVLKEHGYDCQKIVWSLYRKGREKTFNESADKNKYFYLNNIGGFSLFRKRSEYLTKRKYRDISEPFLITWAGMLIKKSDLATIKLPKTDYYVYEDDSEFSINIHEAGYSIYKSDKLILRENSKSWFEKNGKPQSGYRLYYENASPEGRYLYKIRNSVNLTKNKLLTNKLVFYTNIIIFLLAGYLRYGLFRMGSLNKLNKLITAVEAGLNDHLGKENEWDL